MSTVTIKNVTKYFGTNLVLQDFSEEFENQEFVTLLGPSGCGKTTMLRIIAGLEKATSGEVYIDAQLVSGERAFVPPEKRNIGMVFQSYAVWPHMTVFDNVAYPLKMNKLGAAQMKEKVLKVLADVHLSQYADRYPNQLSGGQQQRVALARALVGAPRLLLLDEPLSNLDAKLRESMRFEIKELQAALGITVVYVTHDQTEAMAMSDRIVVINQGIVQQVGTPMEIYNNPANPFVADFVGKVDFIRGTATGGAIEIPGAARKLPYDGPLAGNVIVAFRPENVRFVPLEDAQLIGRLKTQFFLGDTLDCRVELADRTPLRVLADPEHGDIRSRDDVGLAMRSFMVFEDHGEDVLKILT